MFSSWKWKWLRQMRCAGECLIFFCVSFNHFWFSLRITNECCKSIPYSVYKMDMKMKIKKEIYIGLGSTSVRGKLEILNPSCKNPGDWCYLTIASYRAHTFICCNSSWDCFRKMYHQDERLNGKMNKKIIYVYYILWFISSNYLQFPVIITKSINHWNRDGW